MSSAETRTTNLLRSRSALWRLCLLLSMVVNACIAVPLYPDNPAPPVGTYAFVVKCIIAYQSPVVKSLRSAGSMFWINQYLQPERLLCALDFEKSLPNLGNSY